MRPSRLNVPRDTWSNRNGSIRTGASPLAASPSASSPPAVPAVAYPMPDARTPRSATSPLISRNVTAALTALTMTTMTIGIHVFPMPRSEPLTAYHAISIGNPSEPARRYSTPSRRTSGCAPMIRMSSGADANTTSVHSRPHATAAMIAVCSPACTPARSPAPASRATTAVDPTSTASAPASGIQNNSAPMPTAARPSAPTYRPTSAASTALSTEIERRSTTTGHASVRIVRESPRPEAPGTEVCTGESASASAKTDTRPRTWARGRNPA